MKKLAIVAAVGALAGAGSAFASPPVVGTTYSPPTISSDVNVGTNGTDPVVLVVYDAATDISDAVVLGSGSTPFTFNDFAPANLSSTGSITFNVTGFSSTFAADLATDPTGANLRFSVFAESGSGPLNSSIETTANAAAFGALSALSISSIGVINSGLLQPFITNNFAGGGVCPSNMGYANPCVSVSGSDPANYVTALSGGGPDNLGGSITAAGAHTTAALNSSIGFYEVGAAGNTQYAGTWSFDVATGQAIYTVVGAVPLPAALWLMLSGLGGLGVIGRRRAAA